MTKVGIFRNGTQRTYTVSSVTESSEDDEKVDGTKVFTSPNEYNAAMDAIKGMRLGPSFVIASEAVVPVVIAAVNQVPRKERVRIRDQVLTLL